MARDGLTQQQIADNLGINVDTLIEYKKKYTDFSEKRLIFRPLLI